jgi:DNA recombination protein RmuC
MNPGTLRLVLEAIERDGRRASVVRTVAHLWRQEVQSRNTQEIAKRGAGLYDKFVGFVEDMNSIGTRLKQAQSAYEDAHGKL